MYFHLSQGFQYINIQYVRKLDDLDITISHFRKANWYDTVCCESFFSHFKSELLELHILNDEEALIKQVHEYIFFG